MKNSTIPSSSQAPFLNALFGKEAPRAWVTGFTESPDAPQHIKDPKAARAFAGRMWAGGLYRTQGRRLTPEANQYVTVSTFVKDADGKTHRRKAQFEQMRAVMVDDIGPKVEPKNIKLAFTAIVETSPGNKQGWYALDPKDPDTRKREVCERLVEAMIEKGLTKDLTDPGMKGVTRYGRLPDGINNKPGRDAWKVRLHSLHAKRVYTVQQIAKAYKLDITPRVAREFKGNGGAVSDSLVKRLVAQKLDASDRGDGTVDIQCPWHTEHTEGDTSGTAYFLPSAANNGAGGFKCHHGHCEKRTISDVYKWLDAREMAALGDTKKKRVPENKLPMVFMLDDLNTMKIPPTRWLVQDLIAPGLTLLAAPPKQGKSYLALQTIMCVSAGREVIERTTRKCHAVYFDLEEWHGLLKERVDPIRAANTLPGKLDVKIILETGTGEAALKDIAREADEGAEFIVVDILARIRDEMSENAKHNIYARDMAFIGALAQFSLGHPGLALMVVHHANKGVHDDWQAKISGSYGVTGASHTNIYLARPDLRGMSEEDKREAMRYRVLHAVGKQVHDQDITLEMMANMGGWQVSDLKPWEIHTTQKQKQIVMILHERAPEYVTSKELAAILGAKPANVRQMCYHMVKQGTIESAGQGSEGFRAKK